MNNRLIRPFIEKVDLEAIARAVEASPDANATPHVNPAPLIQPQPDLEIESDVVKRFEQVGLTPKEVLVLPGKNNSYEPLGISIYRIGETDKVKQTAQVLGMTYSNTAVEKTSGKAYIGNANWANFLRLNLSLGGITLPLREFADFYLLLKEGKENRAEVRDLEGNLIKKNLLADILDEISGVRNPWRSEWLDADFKILDSNGNVDSSKKGKFYMLRKHILQGGVLVPSDKIELPDAGYISGTDCKADVSSFTEYGLPTAEGNDFSYWYPRKDNNSVAWFGADPGYTWFDCSRHPGLADPSLGVRFASPLGRASAPKLRGTK